jgi:hypothetical protein
MSNQGRPQQVRELHWHQAAEWGFMTHGSCRVTAALVAAHFNLSLAMTWNATHPDLARSLARSAPSA